MAVSIDDARTIVASLPRSYEALVRDRVKFRVGSIVYAAFSREETIMGFAFPRDEREVLVASEPDKFLLPGLSEWTDTSSSMGHDVAVGVGVLGALPDWYWTVPYVGSRYPGAVSRGQLRLGANCQLWAYEVLGFYGFVIPDLRSDELWCDGSASERVDDPEPLDLVLFNADDTPYGAHVGVWTGESVAHLCAEVGQPTLWQLSEFDDRPRYAVRLGYRRAVLLAG